MQVCFYLLLVLHISEGCSLVGNQYTDHITAYSGDSVLLPCTCTEPNTRPESFHWLKQNANTNRWEWIKPNESGQYRNRVQLGTTHSPGNLSLLISHLTEEDGGLYNCRININVYTYIRLTVKGCTLELSKEITDITAHTGDSVLLPCRCTHLPTKPESFIWKKYNPITDTWEVISNESGQYRNRVQMGTTHSPGNLSLLISHLTEEDKGDYECYLKANENLFFRLTTIGISTKKYTPRLDGKITTEAPANRSTVVAPERPEDMPFVIYISTAVGTALLLFLLFGLMGVLCWRYKVQRRVQKGLGKIQTVQMKEQKAQDCSAELCSPAQEDLNALYSTIRKKAQEQDDVTYSTVVHSQKPTPAATPMDNADYTEYASIKLN